MSIFRNQKLFWLIAITFIIIVFRCIYWYYNQKYIYSHNHYKQTISYPNTTNEKSKLIAEYFVDKEFDASNCPIDTWLLQMIDDDPLYYSKVFVDIGKYLNFFQFLS